MVLSTPEQRTKPVDSSERAWKRRHAKSVLEGIRESPLTVNGYKPKDQLNTLQSDETLVNGYHPNHEQVQNHEQIQNHIHEQTHLHEQNNEQNHIHEQNNEQKHLHVQNQTQQEEQEFNLLNYIQSEIAKRNWFTNSDTPKPQQEPWKERVKLLSVPLLFRDVEDEANIIAKNLALGNNDDVLSRGIINHDYDYNYNYTNNKSSLPSNFSSPPNSLTTTTTTNTTTIQSTNNSWQPRPLLSRLFLRKNTQMNHDEPAIHEEPALHKPLANKRLRPRTSMERKFAARTVAGLIAALAEEVKDLRVEVLSCEESPLWRTTLDEIHISFTKLAFKSLKIRGRPYPRNKLRRLERTIDQWEQSVDWQHKREYTKNLQMHMDTNTNTPAKTDLLHSQTLALNNANVNTNINSNINVMHPLANATHPPTADQIFDQMDADQSGTLDQDELFEALNIAMGDYDSTLELEQVNTQTHSKPNKRQRRLWSRSRTELMLERLAARLVQLYDTNGDGVVDREEYRLMVEDMAALRKSKRRAKLLAARTPQNNEKGAFSRLFGSWLATRLTTRTSHQSDPSSQSTRSNTTMLNSSHQIKTVDTSASPADLGDVDDDFVELLQVEQQAGKVTDDALAHANAVHVRANDPVLAGPESGEGSIVIENLKLDMRRLFFGAVPVLKHIVPGGPLILEPFTCRIAGSFNERDFMNSSLLEAGLQRLVARALRRRVRDLRDVIDGAVFFGRTWNMASREAPQVAFPEIENVEFDSKDRLIITGRAKIRSYPGSPEIENSFKLRTKLATSENGRFVRLHEPEIALVMECPKAWERNIVKSCKNLNLKIPRKPRPLYTYIPLASKLKVKDNDGFDLGEDNCIKSIHIKNQALHIEMSSVLRPGRFLGNHYLAFSVPNRTFIITLDRVKEGIRAARQNKRIKELERKEREMIERGELAAEEAKYCSPDDIFEQEELKFDDTPIIRRPSFRAPTSETQTQLISAPPAQTVIVHKENVFSRFIRGYMSASDSLENKEEEWNDRLTTALSEWFGRQEIPLPDNDLSNEIGAAIDQRLAQEQTFERTIPNGKSKLTSGMI